jgi:sensor c-di-GMP phosphodiesterase-like protein
MTDKIDEKFDKAEKIVKRTQSLLIKIIGMLVAIGVAVYLGLQQLNIEKEKTFTKTQRVARIITETDLSQEYQESLQYDDEFDDEYVEQTSMQDTTPIEYDSLYIVEYLYELDSIGDTLYVDIYNDGFVDKYYPTK